MRKLIVALFVMALFTSAVLAQTQAPTLRIVTDDPNLPSDLFYGNVKVKPLRLRPGTNTPITIDDADFFVTEQYIDFLNRFPDDGGLGYWTGEISNRCASTDAACINQRRVSVSAAFFIETEFQQTGYYVYRIYKAGLGRKPNFSEFMPDRRLIDPNASAIEASKNTYANSFTQRAEFLQRYPASLTTDQFVDKLISDVQVASQVDLSSQRGALINLGSRPAILRAIADNTAFSNKEYNPAFVQMQYFGYLRRDPDQGGFDFWLDVVTNREPGNFRGMVCSFITSREYQERFGSTVTRSNQDCSGIR